MSLVMSNNGSFSGFHGRIIFSGGGGGGGGGWGVPAPPPKIW